MYDVIDRLCGLSSGDAALCVSVSSVGGSAMSGSSSVDCIKNDSACRIGIGNYACFSAKQRGWLLLGLQVGEHGPHASNVMR